MIAHCAAPQDDTCVIHKGRITRLCTRRKSINFAPHATQCSKITDVPLSINLQIIFFHPQKRREGSSSTISSLFQFLIPHLYRWFLTSKLNFNYFEIEEQEQSCFPFRLDLQRFFLFFSCQLFRSYKCLSI